MLYAAADRHHVAHAAIIRILRRKNVIKKRPLVEVRIAYLWVDGEKRARHLDHVIDITGFRRAAIDHVVQLVGLA